MAHTLHELKEKTIQDLREIAKGVPDQEAVKLKSVRRQLHRLNRQIRGHMN